MTEGLHSNRRSHSFWRRKCVSRGPLPDMGQGASPAHLKWVDPGAGCAGLSPGPQPARVIGALHVCLQMWLLG